MKRFEYMKLSVTGDDEAVTSELNKFGSEGWELVSSYAGLGRTVLFFKREIS